MKQVAIAVMCLLLSLVSAAWAQDGAAPSTSPARTGRPASRPAGATTRPARDPFASAAPINPNLPTFWIIGDSTVRNGQDDGQRKGAGGQWGWGNPIASFFDTSRINVQNRAVGGTSSRTYQTGNLWPGVISRIKPGDYLIMQFGHNDGGKPDDPARARASLPGNGDDTVEIDNPITKQHEVVHSYGWYIRQYITQAKEKGAKAVFVCSPIPRNAWRDAKVNRNPNYTQWAQAAAKQAGAQFIDLNEITGKVYDTAGQEKVTADYFPQETPPQVVHTNWAGAVINAQSVVEGIKSIHDSDLASYLKPQMPTTFPVPQ